MQSVSIESGGLPEGEYGTPLAAVAKAHPGAIIGSYPSFDGQRFTNQIVVRARDAALLEGAADAVRRMVAELHAAKAARTS